MKLTTEQIMLAAALFVIALSLILVILDHINTSMHIARSLKDIDEHLFQVYKEMSNLNDNIDKARYCISEAIEDLRVTSIRRVGNMPANPAPNISDPVPDLYPITGNNTGSTNTTTTNKIDIIK